MLKDKADLFLQLFYHPKCIHKVGMSMVNLLLTSVLSKEYIYIYISQEIDLYKFCKSEKYRKTFGECNFQ